MGLNLTSESLTVKLVQRNRPQVSISLASLDIDRRSQVQQRLMGVNGTLIISIASRTWSIPVFEEVTITSYRNGRPYTLQYNDLNKTGTMIKEIGERTKNNKGLEACSASSTTTARNTERLKKEQKGE
ncbi:unnamed protein product [Gordionus sp. m RMFG-2023]